MKMLNSENCKYVNVAENMSTGCAIDIKQNIAWRRFCKTCQYRCHDVSIRHAQHVRHAQTCQHRFQKIAATKCLSNIRKHASITSRKYETGTKSLTPSRFAWHATLSQTDVT